MHLLVIPQSNPATDPCYRYRISAFQPFFEQAGFSFECIDPPNTIWQWLQLGKKIKQDDVVILQRKLPKVWQTYLLRRFSQTLIFDFDDAVFLYDSYAKKNLHCNKRLHKFNAILKQADYIVAGNAFLTRQAALVANSDKIIEIPTCVDPNRYPLSSHKQHPIQLVWIGGSSTLQGLERIKPMLNQIGSQIPGIQLKLISDRFLSLDNMHVIPCQWSSQDEGHALASADIGISWIPDDLWSEGKCGLKILQYMAAGLPVVTNPVGVHRNMVKHGVTGFLVNHVQEWIEAITTLAHDAALRKRFGQQGRQHVENYFSVEVNAKKWIALLDHITNRAG